MCVMYDDLLLRLGLLSYSVVSILNVGRPNSFNLNNCCFVANGFISSTVFLFRGRLDLSPEDYRLPGDAEFSPLKTRFIYGVFFRATTSGEDSSVFPPVSPSAASTATVGSLDNVLFFVVVLARTFFLGLGLIISPKLNPATSPFLRNRLTALSASLATFFTFSACLRLAILSFRLSAAFFALILASSFAIAYRLRSSFSSRYSLASIMPNTFWKAIVTRSSPYKCENPLATRLCRLLCASSLTARLFVALESKDINFRASGLDLFGCCGEFRLGLLDSALPKRCKAFLFATAGVSIEDPPTGSSSSMNLSPPFVSLDLSLYILA